MLMQNRQTSIGMGSKSTWRPSSRRTFHIHPHCRQTFRFDLFRRQQPTPNQFGQIVGNVTTQPSEMRCSQGICGILRILPGVLVLSCIRLRARGTALGLARGNALDAFDGKVCGGWPSWGAPAECGSLGLAAVVNRFAENASRLLISVKAS